MVPGLVIGPPGDGGAAAARPAPRPGQAPRQGPAPRPGTALPPRPACAQAATVAGEGGGGPGGSGRPSTSLSELRQQARNDRREILARPERS